MDDPVLEAFYDLRRRMIEAGRTRTPGLKRGYSPQLMQQPEVLAVE
jgi:hypothetical protein